MDCIDLRKINFIFFLEEKKYLLVLIFTESGKTKVNIFEFFFLDIKEVSISTDNSETI